MIALISDCACVESIAFLDYLNVTSVLRAGFERAGLVNVPGEGLVIRTFLFFSSSVFREVSIFC